MLVNQEKLLVMERGKNIKSVRTDIDVKTVRQSIKIFLIAIFQMLKKLRRNKEEI